LELSLFETMWAKLISDNGVDRDNLAFAASELWRGRMSSSGA
jgi:hypothetical protein